MRIIEDGYEDYEEEYESKLTKKKEYYSSPINPVETITEPRVSLAELASVMYHERYGLMFSYLDKYLHEKFEAFFEHAITFEELEAHTGDMCEVLKEFHKYDKKLYNLNTNYSKRITDIVLKFVNDADSNRVAKGQALQQFSFLEELGFANRNESSLEIKGKYNDLSHFTQRKVHDDIGGTITINTINKNESQNIIPGPLTTSFFPELEESFSVWLKPQDVKKTNNANFNKEYKNKHNEKSNDIYISFKDTYSAKVVQLIQKIRTTSQSIDFESADYHLQEYQLNRAEISHLLKPESLLKKYANSSFSSDKYLDSFYFQQAFYPQRLGMFSYSKQMASTRLEAKFHNLFSTIYSNCSYLLQNKLGTLWSILVGNNKNNTIDSEKDNKNTQKVQAGPLTAMDKYEARYGALEQSAIRAGEYSHKFTPIFEKLKTIYTTDSIYNSLGSEAQFNLEKSYPEVIQNLIRQCAVDVENFQLTGQKNPLLPGVFTKLEENLQNIFTNKMEKDHKDTAVLTQYLKAKL